MLVGLRIIVCREMVKIGIRVFSRVCRRIIGMRWCADTLEVNAFFPRIPRIRQLSLCRPVSRTNVSGQVPVDLCIRSSPTLGVCIDEVFVHAIIQSTCNQLRDSLRLHLITILSLIVLFAVDWLQLWVSGAVELSRLFLCAVCECQSPGGGFMGTDY